MNSVRKRDIYVAVTHTSHTLDNTGIQRVTRCLCRALELDYPATNFVSWNESRAHLETLNSEQARCLSAYFGPEKVEPRTDLKVTPTWIAHLPVPRPWRRKVREAWRRRQAHFRFRKGGVLVIPEWVTGSQMMNLVRFSKAKGLRSVAVFHDAIAIDFPNLVSEKFRDHHMDYLKAMTHCDLVLANSEDSYHRFLRFVKEDGEGKPKVDFVALAGEIPGTPRQLSANSIKTKVRALCVGSLDPRKNHQRLIEAFERVWKSNPELKLELVLVGGQYDTSSDLSRWVESKVEAYPVLIWKGRVDDTTLAEEYTHCHFTCFPSLVEGFGIPLLESLWKGRPCLCSSTGVVGDLAKAGGCLTCDPESVDSIADGISKLITKSGLYERLSQEAIARPIKTWRDYGQEFVDRMEFHLG